MGKQVYRDVLSAGGGGGTVSSVYKRSPQCGGTVSSADQRCPQGEWGTVSSVYYCL